MASSNSNFSSTEQLQPKHVLQTKTFWNYSRLICLGTSQQWQWTHLWHFICGIELQPTLSSQTQQGSTFKTLLLFPNNNCIPFVSSIFTLRPFFPLYFFHLPYLPVTSYNHSPQKTRLSVYKNSISEPSVTSSVRTSIAMINKSGRRADLWWTPAFTIDELDSSPSTETAVLQLLQKEITKAKWVTSLDTWSKAFSRSTNIKNNFLFLALNFSVSLLRTNTASTDHLPGINPYCILSISTPHAKSSCTV